MANYELELDLEDTAITHKELVQYESCDWDFVISRAEANGKICIVDDGKITIKAPDFGQDPILNLQHGASLLAFDGEIDARNQYSSIVTTSWDYATQELQEIEATDPQLEEAGNISASDLAAVGGTDTFTMRHSGQVIQDELQAWADAQLLKSRLSKIRGRARFTGFPGIKPGHLTALEGLGNRFNGTVFVSAVRHELKEGEWFTDAQIGLSPEWFTEKTDV